MIRLIPLGVLATLLCVLSACASESPSGAAAAPAHRGTDRWSPVDDFPQARGSNSYMRQ
jgi:hypothetical protein